MSLVLLRKSLEISLNFDGTVGSRTSEPSGVTYRVSGETYHDSVCTSSTFERHVSFTLVQNQNVRKPL